MSRASPPLSRELLERVEQVFGPVCEDANILIWLSDNDADRLVYVNSFAESLWEISREQLYADPYAAADRLHPDDRNQILARFARIEELGDVDETYRVLMPSGRRRWIRAWAKYLPAAEGSSSCTAGMLTDVTEMKTFEMRLKLTVELTRILADVEPLSTAMPRLLQAIAGPLGYAGAGLWLLDPHHQALTCRAFWRRGEELAEFEQASRRIVLREGEGIPGWAWKLRSEAFSTNLPADLHYVRRAAGDRAGLAAIAVFPILAGDRLIGVLELDGTDGLEQDPALREVIRAWASKISLYLERHRLDEEARRETRHLQIISESLSQLLVTDRFEDAARVLLEGILEITGSSIGLVGVVVRGEILRLLAWAFDPLEKLEARDIFQSVQRRSHERAFLDFPRGRNLLWAAIARNTTVMTDEPRRHPDSAGTPDGHPEIRAFLAVPLRAGDEVIGQIAVANRPGGYTAHERARLEGLGALAAVLCQRYRSQRLAESLSEQLRQSQKMEAVGRLAGGVAHDFNNLLQIINGYAEMIGDGVVDEFARDAVDRVRRAGTRAASLTRQLLAFSRKQVSEPRIVDLGKLVPEAQIMFRRLIGEDIEVTQTIEKNLWPVRVDPGQMEQVLMNLLVNARDALPTGGRIRVELANVHYDGNAAPAAAMVPEGSWVRLSVIDNGIGIPQDIQSKVFEPFFTTKSRERGTGLGLSTVFGIVQQSGGLVRLYSEVGKGTTFHVFLPSADGKLEELTEAVKAQSMPRATETVLLVEDQADIRRVVVGMLESAGYTVLSANDVDDALKIARAHTGTIDLVLTDVVMPTMSGPAVADQVRRHRSGLAVLYMSGFSEHEAFPKGWGDGSVHLLRKPFDRTSLLVAVRAALLGRAAAQPMRSHVGHALVVDDSAVSLELLQRLLELKGFSVDGAGGGHEALERLRSRNYDLVLLDVSMPDLSGLDVVRQLRTQDVPWATPAGAPVLAITANASPADRAAAQSAGMNDLVSKPIMIEDLTRALRAWVPAFQRAVATATANEETSREADRIAALKTELGWQNTMRIVTMFLSDVDSKCDTIRCAVERDDLVTVQHAAHALRGAAANVGAERLANVCLELESLARLSVVTEVRQHLTHLLTEATRVHDRLATACRE